MDKNLLSSFLVAAVFFAGAAVQLVRGKLIFGLVGLVLGVLYVTLTLIGWRKAKNQEDTEEKES